MPVRPCARRWRSWPTRSIVPPSASVRCSSPDGIGEPRPAPWLRWPPGSANGACCRISTTRQCRRIDQQGVDGAQIVFAELAGGGLEQQAVDQGVVACPRQVSLGGEQLLLCVQNVDVDSNTDLVAEQVRIECEPTRAFGRL